jgi:hypothetical protein
MNFTLIAEGYNRARNKKHGAGRETIYKSLVLGLMMDTISRRKPMTFALFLVWGWRLYFANFICAIQSPARVRENKGE